MRHLAWLIVIAAQAAQEPVFKHPGYETRAEHDRDGIGKFYMGREIAHVMGHQAIGWLERPERAKEEEPEKVLAALELKSGLVVADVGVGSGYFAFRMSPLVGETGKILGVDIQQEMLDFLKKKAEKLGVKNVEGILGTIDDPKLPEKGVDLVLMVDVYHEFDHPFEMMQAIRKALKPGGRVVFVEYRAEDPTVPIKALHKMLEAQVKKEMEVVGLKHLKTVGTLPRQHILVFTRP
jgi:SAM-dependent methyltransferase